jgi:hypothetical protein
MGNQCMQQPAQALICRCPGGRALLNRCQEPHKTLPTQLQGMNESVGKQHTGQACVNSSQCHCECMNVKVWELLLGAT